MRKFFGFGSSTPPPPPRPPAAPNPRPAPAKSTAAPILGQWKEPNGADATEFRADGTVIEKPASGDTIRGRYSLEGMKLKIKLDGLQEELVFTATINNNELEMKDPDGQVTRYQRV